MVAGYRSHSNERTSKQQRQGILRMDSRYQPEADGGAAPGGVAGGVPGGNGRRIRSSGRFVSQSAIAQRIIAYIEANPGANGQEVVEHCYCGKRYAYRVINKMRKMNLIHVSGWITTNPKGPYVRRFSLGPGADAPKPRSLTRAEIMRRHRDRMEPIERDLENVKKKTRRHKVKVDPLMTAFFGGKV